MKMTTSINHFFTLHGKSLLLCCFLSACCLKNYTVAADYELTPLASVNNGDTTAHQWQQIQADPGNVQQYFIAEASGKILVLNNGVLQPSPLLSLTAALPDSIDLKLTAFHLHPNFAQSEQPGYRTFYSAHLEAVNSNTTSMRLKPRDRSMSLPFDAVITEWQLDPNALTTNLSSRREIMRIALPNENHLIAQLDFNPFKNSWDEGFGLLYIALSSENTSLAEPLYSGALLRIDPTKFGLRNYTVPHNNPFARNKNIANEIYLLGAPTIKQFLWPNKLEDKLMVVFRNQGKLTAVLADAGDDWREQQPAQVIYQALNPETEFAAILYRGQQMAEQRNKLLLFEHDDNSWNLKTLALNPYDKTFSEINNILAGFDVITKDSPIILAVDQRAEVLLLTPDKLFAVSGPLQLQNQSTPAVTALPETVEVTEKDNNTLVYIALLLFIFGSIASYFWQKSKSCKTILRKNFNKIMLNDHQDRIGLLHRHQPVADAVFAITDIEQFDVFLNDTLLCTVSADSDHVFNQAQEAKLSKIFTKEQALKMVNDRRRHVLITFTTNQKKRFPVSLYLRKGIHRLTATSLNLVLLEIIDLCWLISAKINPHHSEKRRIKVKNEP